MSFTIFHNKIKNWDRSAPQCMIHRWVTYVVFLLLVSFVAWLRAPAVESSDIQQGQVSWKATIDLPQNTLLAEEHLQSPDVPSPVDVWELPKKNKLKGKYVTKCVQETSVDSEKACIPKNRNVTLNNLSVLPDLGEKPNSTLLIYEVQDLNLPNTVLNANARIYLCEGGTNGIKKCEGGPFRVEAAVGGKKSILIRMSNSDADKVGSLKTPKLRLAALP